MTTLCSPIDCDLKDSCLRYATDEVVERSPWSQFADFSQDLKIGGKCPWYKPKEITQPSDTGNP